MSLQPASPIHKPEILETTYDCECNDNFLFSQIKIHRTHEFSFNPLITGITLSNGSLSKDQ